MIVQQISFFTIQIKKKVKNQKKVILGNSQMNIKFKI